MGRLVTLKPRRPRFAIENAGEARRIVLLARDVLAQYGVHEPLAKALAEVAEKWVRRFYTRKRNEGGGR